MAGYKNKAKDNILWKHAANDDCSATNVKFVMKVLKTHESQSGGTDQQQQQGWKTFSYNVTKMPF